MFVFWLRKSFLALSIYEDVITHHTRSVQLFLRGRKDDVGGKAQRVQARREEGPRNGQRGWHLPRRAGYRTQLGAKAARGRGRAVAAHGNTVAAAGCVYVV